MQNLLLTVIFLTGLSAFGGVTAIGEAGGGNDNKRAPIIEGEIIRIDISDKGEIFLDGQICTLSGLKEFLESRVRNPQDKIIVTADEETIQENVVSVMDVCCNYKYCKIKLFYKPSWIHKG